MKTPVIVGDRVEDASAQEQPVRTVQAVFRVRLSLRSKEPVTVDFETEAGTAQAGSDFAPRSGTLRFAPGETLKMIRVPVSGDGVKEGQEEFTVRLTNPTNAEFDRDRATGTIRDPGPRLPGPRH